MKDKEHGLRMSYRGTIAHHKREGEGSMVYVDGQKYTGAWADGVRCGRGRMEYLNGDVYKGEWSHDTRHGQGTLYNADGDVYQGDWCEDQKHGQGTRFYVKRLQSLHIESCHMSAISSHWSLLMNLSTADMETIALMSVQSEPFQNMHLLSSCTICKCCVSTIQDNFFLSKWYLTSLNLSCNALSTLPNSIGLATALTSINLDKNQLVSLPETWTSLRSLVLCTMKKNCISSDLEALLMYQSNLQSLNLSYNHLQHFPCDPQHHTNLECLDVSHNKIVSTRHSNFSHWKKLKKLKVNDNLLDQPMLELPIILEVAKDLRCIDFSGNPMTFLPENCKKNAANMLVLLETLLLVVRTREITAVHGWDSDTLSFLLSRSDACILRATLQNVGLIQHPQELMLHDIVVLDLSSNCIETISKQLSHLTALKSLNLSKNVISVCKEADVSLHLPYIQFHNVY